MWALECLVYYQGFYGTTDYYGRGDFLTPKYEQEDLAFLSKMAKTSIFDSKDTIAKRVTAFTRLYKALRATMAILARDPIMVDTGSYQPKYQMRTYADMEGEIANYLANQANYHAKVKIVNAGEYVICTKPAPEGLTGDALTQRIETVKRHMRALGYTRHYTEVIEEARKRQEYLFGLGDTPDEDAADDGDEPDEPLPGSFTLD
jgi:flagellar basal body rod protein FlgB